MVAFIWVFPTSFLMFKLISKTVGLRVSSEEELQGLDLVEHGANCYPDFAPTSGGGGISLPGGASPSPGLAAGKVTPAEAEA